MGFKTFFSTIMGVAGLTFLVIALIPLEAKAQRNGESVQAAPDRTEGLGPFPRLVIRGATVIDGTGAPPYGPVDIVIEGNRIAEVSVVGSPFLAIDPEGRPAEGDFEIDATGMYVLPGFINAHAHISNTAQFRFGEAAPAEYAYKLWLSHGITTIREVGAGNGRDWTLNEKARSAANAITAPRIVSHMWFPGEMTPKEARAALARAVREDLRAGRVLSLDGWLVAETEARLYALAALERGRGRR